MSAQHILYLDVPTGNPAQERKVAGVRHYAALRRWEVVVVPRRGAERLNVRSLLSRNNPLGVIVEGSGRKNAYPPSLFGKIPVSYIEYPAREIAGLAANISVDEDAIADTAFRELSLGNPACFAVIGHRNPHLWSKLRVQAFRNRCAKAGASCIVFPQGKNEATLSYETRLAEWMAALPPKAAIFAACDSTGATLSRVTRVARRHIPKDLTLCSTCDIPEVCDGAPTPVTSIHIDFERMGWLAAKALVDGEDASAGPLFVARRQSTSGRGRREPWILRAVEIIRAEACEGRNVESLVGRLAAEYCSGADGDGGMTPVSRRNFDRRFREAMGHSALEEILSVRLAAARELLLKTDTPITAVPDFCGFGCYRTLDALFRSRFGMSMGAWRAKNVY